MICRFLYLVGQLGAGGSEHQLYLLLKTLEKQRYRPAVVVWRPSEEDIYASRIRALAVPIYRLGTISPVRKLVDFRRLVSQVNPQIVHSYSFYTNLAAWWGTLGSNAIAIGAVRSDFEWAKEGNGHLLGKLSARWPRTQIFNSSVALDQARRCRGLFAPRRCLLVRNAIDLEIFSAVPPPLDERPRVLAVGSLLPIKRWDRVLRATVELKRRGLSFLIQIAGDGVLRRELDSEARRLEITDVVKFLGHRNDIPQLLADSRFLVHTSDSEGCPNVIVEAMACGRPVIATSVGDIPHLITNGTGLLVRPGDDSGLVECMARLLVNRDLCWRMGMAGRAAAEREFGLRRLVNETLTAYEALGWTNPA